MAILTIEKFAELRNSLTVVKDKFYIPVWDAEVYMRRLSAGEAMKIYSRAEKVQDEDKKVEEYNFAMYRMVIACLVDENGNQMLTENDINWLLSQDVQVVTALVEAASKMNTINEKAQEEAEKTNYWLALDVCVFSCA